MQKILFQEHKGISVYEEVEVVLEINDHMVIFQYDGCSFYIFRRKS